MLGHVAQSVGAALPGVAAPLSYLPPVSIVRTGGETFEWVAPEFGVVEVWGFGGGGGGTANNGGGGGGGGGGRFDWFSIEKGQKITASIGLGGARATTTVGPASPGGDTIVTLPDGRVGTARGGGGGSGASSTIASGGTASGFDLNSKGGDTRQPGENNNGGVPIGLNRYGGSVGGVGASAPFGFPPQNSGVIGGQSPGNGGNSPGENGNTNSGPGGSGALVIIYRQVKP